MDQYLLFDIHINHVCKKVNGVLIYLNRIKDRLDRDTRLIVVQSLALSIISYCLKVWGMTTKEQLDRVQKVQNFAARVAYGGLRKYDHVSPIFAELKWLYIEKKLMNDISIFAYKVCNKLLPDWLFSFATVGDHNVRPTRQSSDLFISRTKTDIGARSISIRGAKIWNAIPQAVKDSNSLHVFRRKLKQYFLET